MFFPDRAHAFAQARRVLRPGGAFLFNAWNRIEDNEFAHLVTDALAQAFPTDPPRFLARMPDGYHDEQTIARDLLQAGFTAAPRIDTVTARSRAASASVPAMAYCQGTPLRNEIEARYQVQGATLGAATRRGIRARAAQRGKEGRRQGAPLQHENAHHQSPAQIASAHRSAS